MDLGHFGHAFNMCTHRKNDGFIAESLKKGENPLVEIVDNLLGVVMLLGNLSAG